MKAVFLLLGVIALTAVASAQFDPNMCKMTTAPMGGVVYNYDINPLKTPSGAGWSIKNQLTNNDYYDYTMEFCGLLNNPCSATEPTSMTQRKTSDNTQCKSGGVFDADTFLELLSTNNPAAGLRITIDHGTMYKSPPCTNRTRRYVIHLLYSFFYFILLVIRKYVWHVTYLDLLTP
jgi:hypothetical protein